MNFRPHIERGLTLLLAGLLGGCGTVASVGVIAVEATATVVGVAVDGVVLVGKGVIKGGELVVDAMGDQPAKK